MNRGVTLIELLLALTLIGLLSLIAVPRFAVVRDRLAVDHAAQEVAMFYYRARQAAILEARSVRIEFAADTLRAVYQGEMDSVALTQAGPTAHGVQLTASRAVIRLYANGIGLGAANTRLVLTRGEAVATLTTSRLGRLKRW